MTSIRSSSIDTEGTKCCPVAALVPGRAPNRKIRPPVKWHGGKYYQAKHIIGHFPEHHTYVEPFGGAASVLLNKSPSPVEIYNDLDERITRLFRVLRDRGQELQRLLTLTPYSEAEFRSSSVPTDDEVEQARQDFRRWRQSIGGQGESFSFTLHRSRRGMADVVSGYLSAIDEQLPLIVERLRSVQIVNRRAFDVIRVWDAPETLFYCDPPYLHSTRAKSSRSVYNYEMTDDQHVELAAVLRSCQGRAIVSGYPSALYDEIYAGWERVSFGIANHAAIGRTKERMQEILWIKPQPVNPRGVER